MWVEWDDDARLSQSHTKPGDYSPLTRDAEGNLAGHVTLNDVDDDDDLGGYDSPYAYAPAEESSESSRDELAEIVVLVTTVLALKAAPHVQRWWSERAAPTLRSARESARGRFTRNRTPNEASASELVEVVDQATRPGDHVSDALPDRQSPRISTDEAQQRLFAALLARAFSDAQIRILLNSEIEDDDGTLGLKLAPEQFSSEAIEGHVYRMLEADSSLPDQLFALLQGERVADMRRLLSGEPVSRGAIPPTRNDD